MKKIIYILFVLLLSGCLFQKKVDNQVANLKDGHPLDMPPNFKDIPSESEDLEFQDVED